MEGIPGYGDFPDSHSSQTYREFRVLRPRNFRPAATQRGIQRYSSSIGVLLKRVVITITTLRLFHLNGEIGARGEVGGDGAQCGSRDGVTGACGNKSISIFPDD